MERGSLGAHNVRILKNGGTAINTLGYQHQETPLEYVTNREVFEVFATGVTGAREARAINKVLEVTGSFFFDKDTKAEILNEEFIDNQDGTYTEKGAQGMLQPLFAVELSPKDSAEVEDKMLIVRAHIIVNENLGINDAGLAEMVLTIRATEDEEGVMVEHGQELALPE